MADTTTLATRIRARLDDEIDIRLSPEPYAHALQAVLDLHRPATIREPCADPDNHDAWEITAGEWVCARCGPTYTVCEHCCMDGSSTSDLCDNDHGPEDCWPCPTITAIAEALGIKEPTP